MEREVLNMLESIKFPKNRSRKNISNETMECFALGEVNYRGQKSLGGKTRGESRWNKKYPELYKLLREFIQDKDFEYTTIQVNKNIVSKPHVDKNNVGISYGIAIGDFTGGELVIEGKPFDIHNKWKHFDGRKGHWVNPFEGTRYSLIYFTHTFKPPNAKWRHVDVRKDGLYKKGSKIVDYI